MQKYRFISILAAIMSLALAACSGGGDDSSLPSFITDPCTLLLPPSSCQEPPPSLPPPPDTSPPTAPGNLVAQVGSAGEVDLIWDQSYDSFGVVAGYKVYKDGTFLKSVTGTSGSDNTVPSDTIACYTVTAYDKAGYESNESNRACADTSLWVSSTVTSNADYVSIAADSARKLHISFRDRASNGLKYATNALGPWTVDTVDSNRIDGGNTSIAIDTADMPHISYYGYADMALEFATNVTGTWTVSTVDTNGAGQYSSIAVDSSNKTHIAYYDWKNSNLKYATNVTGVWTTEVIDGNGPVGLYPSIAVDANDKVHVSYYDQTNLGLKYATNESGAWAVYILDSGGYYSSIAVDSANKVHIAYVGFDYMIKHVTNESGSWIISAIEKGSHPSIAVDSSDEVHISYSIYYTRFIGSYSYYYNDLKFATNKLGTWDTFTLASGGIGSLIGSLAVDSANAVRICYYDDILYGDLKCLTNQ
jgi:hypothetical protein